MSTSSFINIPLAVLSDISSWAEAAYPHEGCGLLIGRFLVDGGKEVARLAVLKNELLSQEVTGAPTLPSERQGKGAGRTEFLMNPAEFEQETLKAEKEGLDVVGIIHTHPDHPPRPSVVDASQPFLSQWSNIIVAVEKGRVHDLKSWFREIEEQPFVEEEIRVGK